MKGARKKPAANLRSWRVIIIRSKIMSWLGRSVGSQEGEAVAIKQFDLDQDQRSRLVIRERL